MELESQGRGGDMSNYADLCYFNLAKNKSDVSICDKIPTYDDWQGEPSREFCYALVENNPDACYNLKEDKSTKMYCLYSIAYRTRDISICRDFEEGQKNACYRTIAVLNNDISMCEKIDNKRKYNSTYSSCLLNFVNDTTEISFCDKMNNYISKNMCYKWLIGYIGEYRYKHRPIG